LEAELVRIEVWFCILMLISLISAGFCGCDVESLGANKSVPAPLVDNLPYEIANAWNRNTHGGDNIEVVDDELVHYIVLEGIDAPKPEQELYWKSLGHLHRLLSNKSLRVEVLGYDEMKREIARVYVGNTNVSLQMAKDGMAWWDGCEFEGADEIKAAEAEARQSKIGLWKPPKPAKRPASKKSKTRDKGEG
jgi:hypothetical protein